MTLFTKISLHIILFLLKRLEKNSKEDLTKYRVRMALYEIRQAIKKSAL